MKEFKITLTIIFVLFIIIILTGCKTEININDYIDKNASLKFKIGRDSFEYTDIEVNSNKYKKLIQWGNENVSGWQMTPASYISDICVIQGEFRLLTSFNSNGVVIGFNDKNGKPKQYNKAIIKGELDFLAK